MCASSSPPPRKPHPSPSPHPPRKIKFPIPNTNLQTRQLILCAAIFLLALAVRFPLLPQSLWYDEMYTSIYCMAGPWRNVICGDYSPNNHLLFSLLAKACLTAGGSPEIVLRLPSLLAGSTVGIALAWPLRRSHPILALLLAVLTAFSPWLISFSTEARGYALLLLLAALATNALPQHRQLLNWPYILCVVAALYTVPIAAVLVLAHGITLLIHRRQYFSTWLRSAAAAGLASALLYCPFFSGIAHYYTHPAATSMPYPQFLLDLPTQIVSAQSAGSPWTWIALLPLLAPLLIPLPPRLVTAFTSWIIATVIALLLPLLVKTAGEPRFVLWLIPASTISYAVLANAFLRLQKGFIVTGSIVAATLTWSTLWALHAPPQMPIRDAVTLAKQRAGNAQLVVGVYIASLEARTVYGNPPTIAYTLHTNPQQLPALDTIEAHALRKTGHLPWLIVFNDPILHRDQPDLWQHIQDHYTLDHRLPGRLADALIIRPR